MAERRTAVVTGASAGIGKAAAMRLAREGWNVIAHGRDAERSAAAEAEIRAAAAPGARVHMLRADLALVREAARMADEIAAITPRVDALLANAGGVRAERLVTDEGNEATFAGNHLGHFVLTTRLLPQLRAAGVARVISVSSTGHEQCPGFDWNDPQLIDNWLTGTAYCQAKLANILFTRELAHRYGADGMIAHAMHPGVVGSNFVNHADQRMRDYMLTLDLRPPEEACDTLVWLASDPEPGRSNGLYWHQRTAIEPASIAQDSAEAATLWAYSEERVGVSGF